MKKNNCTKKTSIGGQALIEGIMMRGPLTTAMAVRNTDGQIIIEKEENSIVKAPKFFKLPLIRGIYNMVVSFTLGYKYLMRSAEISGLEDLDDGKEEKSDEKKQKENKALMGVIGTISAVLGVVLAVFLFIYLPSQLYSWLALPFPSIKENYLLRSIFEGVLKITIFIAYMASMRLIKDIRRTFMYHGAEHKTIFCYEAGQELTVENIRKQRKYHPRCGTSFMILILIVSIVISMFIRVPNPMLRTVIRLLVLPVTIGIGYELIKFAGRHDNILTKIISFPGMLLQHISVMEPTDDMIECAIAAMKEVIPEDKESDNW